MNHNGQWCPYLKIYFCQEGYCQDCQVYLRSKTLKDGDKLVEYWRVEELLEWLALMEVIREGKQLELELALKSPKEYIPIYSANKLN